MQKGDNKWRRVKETEAKNTQKEEAMKISQSILTNPIKAQDSIMPGIIESSNEKRGWKQVE